MLTNRENSQREALNAWIDANCVGTIFACTGWGKTKLGIEAINSLSNEIKTVKIIVPTTNLREREWKEELNKWGNNISSLDIDIKCTKTVYKQEEETVDLLIVDEVHLALSEEYRKIFKQIKYKYILCLTATPPENKEYLSLLEFIAPVVYHIKLNEASKLGIVSNYQIYNVPVKMTKKEKFKYGLFVSMFIDGKSKLEALMRQDKSIGNNAFDIASKYNEAKYKSSNSKLERDLHYASKEFWSGMQLRKKLLHTLDAKIDAAVSIIRQHSDVSKWIVFTKYTTQAEEICRNLNILGIKALSYHSKLDEKTKSERLKKLNNSEIKVICSAVALQTGFNLPEIDGAIAISFTSEKISFIQSLGRAIRFKDGKIAKYFHVYCPDTQEEVWLNKRCEGEKPIKLTLNQR